ncbi:MAG: hypothetical protein FWG91_11660 [Lachnospiraceae bacterium]|nr:hypothetical protein [Lachnospiraceae bacterium]
MNIEELKIRDKVINILCQKTEIQPEKLAYENDTKALTGPLFRLNARDMTYFFMEVKKEFSLKLNIEQIKAYEFNTIAGIIELIKKYRENQ